MTRILTAYQMSEKEKGDDSCKSHPHKAAGSPYKKDEDRSCTDLLFIIVLFAVWITMCFVGGYHVKNGDPYRLINPVNDQGQVCGETPAVEGSAFFYPVVPAGVGVCVTECPSVNVSLTDREVPNFYCLASVLAAYPQNKITGNLALSTYINNWCFDSFGEYSFASNCGCMPKFRSISVLGRCQFLDNDVANNFITQGPFNYLTTFVADIFEAKSIVFGWGIVVPILLCFIWMAVLRFECLTTMAVWTLIVGVEVLFIIIIVLAYTTANQWKEQSPRRHSLDEIKGLKVVSALFFGFATLWLVFICFVGSSIQLAIKTASLTADAIEHMPVIMFTPLVQVTGMIAFLIPWVFYIFFIASNGNLQTATYYPYNFATTPPIQGPGFQYVKLQLFQGAQEALWFLFFVYLWTMEFIVAIGTLIISTAFAKWYFTPSEHKHLDAGNNLVGEAYSTVLRYHIGTAAFGSLIVAIVEFIRYVVMYIEKQVKAHQDNTVVKFVFCCINCCLWCLENILKFITKNAYIQTAIHGTAFCESAKNGFFLICRNILRIGALHVVSGFALIIAKLFITVFVGATSYFIFTGGYINNMRGYMGPTVLTMILAWTISSAFMDVFRTGTDTILQCYITDEEFNDGHPQFADSSLKKVVDDHAMSQEAFDEHHAPSSSCCGCGKTHDPVPTSVPSTELATRDSEPDATTRV